MAALLKWMCRWPEGLTTSSTSSCEVAGRTISAKRAVSVMNCSWTTVKRSSRRSPRMTLAELGVEVAGLAMKTSSALIGVGDFAGERGAKGVHVDDARLG